jgi:hypothetical protein
MLLQVQRKFDTVDPAPGSPHSTIQQSEDGMHRRRLPLVFRGAGLLVALLTLPALGFAQGVTTAALSGLVTSQDGSPIVDANIVALHLPSGTQYRAVARSGGAYTIPNIRVGGPYRVTAAFVGYEPKREEDVFLSLGQNLRLDFSLVRQAVQLQAREVAGVIDEVLNAGRTGAATFIDPTQVALLPSIKRSTRDLTRLDPRSDGNFSFAGRNWLYNNISLDGSYFNNPFGLEYRWPRSTCAKGASRVPTSIW